MVNQITKIREKITRIIKRINSSQITLVSSIICRLQRRFMLRLSSDQSSYNVKEASTDTRTMAEMIFEY